MEERRKDMKNDDFIKEIEQRMAGRQFSEEEMDCWITEDMTEEYDRIVLRKKMSRNIWRWAAVASVVIIIGLAGWGVVSTSNTTDTLTAEKNTQLEEKKAESREQSVKHEQSVMADANVTPETATPATKKNANNDRLVPIEELAEVMAELTEQNNRIEDSVDVAHIKQYIETDEKLFQTQQRMTCLNCE